MSELKDAPLTQRVCKHCAEIKPIEQFYKTSSNGYRHRCKSCETIRRAEYFQKYHEKNYKAKTNKVGRPKKIIVEFQEEIKE
jgi:hypothetical protein